MDNFWSKVNKTSTCWLWTGYLFSNGYGGFNLNGKSRKAHRIAYELLVGKIPDGLELDHVRARGCTNKHCVNPDHLEPVTFLENMRRRPNVMSAKTHCPQGHEYTPENIYTPKDHSNWRGCLTCRRATANRYYEAHKFLNK